MICEVRDHRGKVPGEYEKQLLLLQPTPEVTILTFCLPLFIFLLQTVLTTVSKISHEMKCTAVSW